MRLAQYPDAQRHLGAKRGCRLGPLQYLGVFVADYQKPRARRLDLGPFRGVDQPLDRAIDHDLDLFQRLDHRAVALYRPRGPVGFDRHRRGVGIMIMQ